MIRLELLLQFGGLYIDMDVLLLQPLDDMVGSPMAQSLPKASAGGMGSTTTHLAGSEVVLAHEGVGGSIGLGNAWMLSRPNATMLRLWYAEYRYFSDRIWNNFSVRLPSRLAAEHMLGQEKLGARAMLLFDEPVFRVCNQMCPCVRFCALLTRNCSPIAICVDPYMSFAPQDQ